MDNLRSDSRVLSDTLSDNGYYRNSEGEANSEIISKSAPASQDSSEYYSDPSSEHSSEYSKSSEFSSEGSSEEGSEEYSSEYTEGQVVYEEQLNDLVRSNRAQAGLFMILLVSLGLFITVRFFLRLFNK